MCDCDVQAERECLYYYTIETSVTKSILLHLLLYKRLSGLLSTSYTLLNSTLLGIVAYCNEALLCKSFGTLNNQLPNYIMNIYDFIRACRMNLDDTACSQSQACMNWSNHKNVHCMRLNHVRCRICNLASWTNHMLMSWRWVSEKLSSLEPKTVKESHSR